MTDSADLVARLRKGRLMHTYPDGSELRSAHPDGPEAADRIEALVGERDEALEDKRLAEFWGKVGEQNYRELCERQKELRAERDALAKELAEAREGHTKLFASIAKTAAELVRVEVERDAARADERERCARIAEGCTGYTGEPIHLAIAAAIRRG